MSTDPDTELRERCEGMARVLREHEVVSDPQDRAALWAEYMRQHALFEQAHIAVLSAELSRRLAKR
jgi:hypothetical protein